MVETLLSYPGINLLKTDARQLHAGFYAVENKSREDGENILRQLLQKEPAMVFENLMKGKSIGRKSNSPYRSYQKRQSGACKTAA